MTSMSVSLFTYLKNHSVQVSKRNFLYMLSVAVARSSCNDNAACYVLLVFVNNVMFSHGEWLWQCQCGALLHQVVINVQCVECVHQGVPHCLTLPHGNKLCTRSEVSYQRMLYLLAVVHSFSIMLTVTAHIGYWGYWSWRACMKGTASLRSRISCWIKKGWGSVSLASIFSIVGISASTPLPCFDTLFWAEATRLRKTCSS